MDSSKLVILTAPQIALLDAALEIIEDNHPAGEDNPAAGIREALASPIGTVTDQGDGYVSVAEDPQFPPYEIWAPQAGARITRK